MSVVICSGRTMTASYVMPAADCDERQIVYDDSNMLDGWRLYLLEFAIRVNGGDAWIADTMTKLVIESTQALGNDRFCEIPIGNLTANAKITKSTSGIILLEPFFVGGIASMGASITCDGTVTDGSDLQILMHFAIGS